jgi:hypothetical protein
MSTFCGTVSTDGQIISDGNFSCKYDSGQKKATISYNGNVTNLVVVVSPTLQAPGLSNIIYSYSGRLTMLVFQNVSRTITPVASSFNFIVKDM